MCSMEKVCRESADAPADELESAHVHQADECEDDADDYAGIGAHFRMTREITGLVSDADDSNHHTTAGQQYICKSFSVVHNNLLIS